MRMVINYLEIVFILLRLELLTSCSLSTSLLKWELSLDPYPSESLKPDPIKLDPKVLLYKALNSIYNINILF